MPARRGAALTLLVLVLTAAPAAAGLYSTAADPEEMVMAGKAEDINRFREAIFKLRGLAADKVEVDYPLRRRYVLTADLAARNVPESLSAEEKLNLSAVLLRRGRAGEALQLLIPLSRQQPDHPLVQSNLATAYHLSGELRSASDTMESILSPRSKVWPPTWHDLTEGQQKLLQAAGWSEDYDRYRKVEKAYAKLLKLRYRESLRKGKGDEQVDALFDDGKSPATPVLFVNDSGAFEPGRVAASEKAKLPKDAVDTVQQLLLWLPADPRLYRLLGELYNARGTPADVKAAALIFDDLVRNKYTPGDVQDRHEKLRAYAANLPDAMGLRELEGLVTKDEDKRATGLPFDVKSMVISFGFGMAVGVFVVWQVREIRRRRHARQPAG